MYDTGIADRIRNKVAIWKVPLDVVEVDDWRTRGREFPRRPSLAVGHHTANPNMGWAPSLGICTNGRAGVPGPLCNALRARKRNGRYTVFVIAAGVANHAGKGDYAGRTGNSQCYGLEVENKGTPDEPWTSEDQEIDALILAAMLDGAGALTCEHKEWAPGRKIDRHSISGDRTRGAVLRYLATQPPAPSLPDEDDMEIIIPQPSDPPHPDDKDVGAQYARFGDVLIGLRDEADKQQLANSYSLGKIENLPTRHIEQRFWKRMRESLRIT